MIEYNHVDGKDKGSVRLFALSTCVWCRKTKRLLDSLKVAYDFVYTDVLDAEKRNEVIDEIEKWNPRCSFPTLIINNEKTIIGFKEKRIREALEE